MPATMQRSRVCSKASAVSATIGTVAAEPSGRARIARVAPMPSSTGMCRSISTTSKTRCCTACTASCPLAVKCASWPRFSSSAARYCRLTGWSSATSTISARALVPATAASSSGPAGGSTTGTSGIWKVKALPAPGLLRTLMSPPISRASVRDISSPSPVPPWRRAGELSPCPKRVNRFFIAASSMPAPVSVTTNSSSGAGPPGWRTRTSSTTWPWSENLMALDSRLNRICLTRVASSTMRSGTSGSASMCSASVLALACGRISASTSRSSARRSTGAGDSDMRPASSCDMSRMSLRIANRWSADSVAVRR